MARLVFSDNFRRHLGELPKEGAGETVAMVLTAALSPKKRGYLVDERGGLRKHINVFVNNQPVMDRVALSDPVQPSDEIYVMQALSGG